MPTSQLAMPQNQTDPSQASGGSYGNVTGWNMGNEGNPDYNNGQYFNPNSNNVAGGIYAGMSGGQLIGASAPSQYGPGGQQALTQSQQAISSENALAGNINGQIGYYQGMQGPSMTGAQLSAAPQYGAMQNGFNANSQGAQIGGAVNAGQVNINTAQANQDRNLQMQNISALQQQAAGQGPSVAAQQAQNSSQAAIAGQMAAMASQRGASNSALGLRQAQTGAAANQQQAAQNAVTGRLQEQLNAQQQLGSNINNLQGQDIGLATNQAGLTQQTNLANAAAANAVNSQNATMAQQNNQYNTGLNASVASQNAGFAEQSQLANQSMAGQYGLAQGQLDETTGEQNLNAQLQQQNMNNQMVGNLYGQEGALYGNVANQNLATAGQISGQGMAAQQLSQEQNEFGVNTGMQIGSSLVSMAGAFSDENVKQGIQTIEANDDSTVANEESSLTAGINKQNQIMASGQSNHDKGMMGGSSSGGSGGGLSSMMSSFGGGSSGGGDAAASAASDETKKKNIHDEDEYQAQSFLDALKAHTFEYKDPSMGKGRFTGVMAQELEKTPVGKQAVINTPKGKVVDYARLASVMLAGMVMMHNEIKELKMQGSLKGDK